MTGRMRKFLYVLFFFSGFVALGYEIIWTRLLLLTFGNTTYSVVVVLAAFMGGLALGNYIFGKQSPQIHNHLHWFGVLELGIGLLAFLSPIIFTWLNRVYPVLVAHEINGFSVVLVKFIMTSLVLLPATTLMGGTFPILISGLVHSDKLIPELTSNLYVVNTLGAVAGTLYTAFVAIELFGLVNTIYINAVVNGLIFLIALNEGKQVKTKPTRITEKKQFRDQHWSFQYSIVIFLYGLSGVTAMSLEVLWVRLLAPTVGTYIYAFSGILATFLSGLAVGGWLYKKIFRSSSRTFFLLGLAELTISLSAFFSIVVVSSGLLPNIRWLQMLAVILPGTCAMGMILPIISRMANRHQVGWFIGKALAFNSVGSVIGPIFAGFILIPVWGSSRSVLIISLLTAIFAVILFSFEPMRKDVFRDKALRLVSLVFIGALTLTVVTHSDKIFTQRFLKYQQALHKDDQTIILEDEVATVFAYTSKDVKRRGLIIDGVETTGLVAETKLMAHLPLLVHPSPKDVLVVALGMGTTFRSSLTYPVNRVDVVELVPSVVKTLPLFHEDVENILTDSRAHIIVNDGRQYVLVTKQHYDVVTIDPPPPVNSAGTTVLYSQEFYQQIKQILKPGGVVQQWFFFDTTTQEEELKMLLKTFIDEFAYALVFRSPNTLGVSIVASDSPIALSQKQLTTRLTLPEVKNDLMEWSGTPSTFQEITALFIGDKTLVEKYVDKSPIVTDSRPQTEYFLLKRLFFPSPWVDPETVTQDLLVTK